MIPSDFIRSYLLSKFPDGKISGDGTELIIPSIFIEGDYKRHQSVNLDTGLWRCFKSGEKGNFIYLYSILEKIPYKKAYQEFLFQSFLVEDRTVEPEKIITNTELEDPSTFEKLDLTKEYDELVMALASEFVYKRKMEKFTFYVAKEGFYKNRLIIPFFNDSGKLFFFQARALLDSMQPKYLNCKTLKSSQVLYPFDYESFDPLYITEGVFDCLALRLLGRNTTTTLSCNTSKEQMEQLNQYRGPLVCAFDNDDAGSKGRKQFMNIAHRFKRDDIFYVVPGFHYKDWNECLIKGANFPYIYDKLNEINLVVNGL